MLNVLIFLHTPCQWWCHALCKIFKQLNDSTECHKWMRSHVIWVWDEFWRDVLFHNTEQLLGSDSIWRWHFTSIEILIGEIRWSYDISPHWDFLHWYSIRGLGVMMALCRYIWMAALIFYYLPNFVFISVLDKNGYQPLNKLISLEMEVKLQILTTGCFVGEASGFVRTIILK